MAAHPPGPGSIRSTAMIRLGGADDNPPIARPTHPGLTPGRGPGRGAKRNAMSGTHQTAGPGGARMPVLFVGHGSPMNAIEDNAWSRGFRDLARLLPRPKAILAISAHWYVAGTFTTANERPETIHDFGGFPEELHRVQYPAPGSADLARRAVALVGEERASTRSDWGLDHGTWSVLLHLLPGRRRPGGPAQHRRTPHPGRAPRHRPVAGAAPRRGRPRPGQRQRHAQPGARVRRLAARRTAPRRSGPAPSTRGSRRPWPATTSSTSPTRSTARPAGSPTRRRITTCRSSTLPGPARPEDPVRFPITGLRHGLPLDEVGDPRLSRVGQRGRCSAGIASGGPTSRMSPSCATLATRRPPAS